MHHAPITHHASRITNTTYIPYINDIILGKLGLCQFGEGILYLSDQIGP